MIGSPKNVESIAMVEIVKLCSPLSQRVISFGRFPMASASCFLERPFFCIRKSNLLDIAKESSTSNFVAAGISAIISINFFSILLIYQNNFLLDKVSKIFYIYVKCLKISFAKVNKIETNNKI